MTTQEILKEWLEDHGYDGLCNIDCGCGVDDLFCCYDSRFLDCKPAYKHERTTGEVFYREEKPNSEREGEE